MFNSSSHSLHPIQVNCYSGRSYSDRPISFVLRQERYEITSIEREWLEPDQKHFIVQAIRAQTQHDEKRLEICYHTQEDIWHLNEIQ